MSGNDSLTRVRSGWRPLIVLALCVGVVFVALLTGADSPPASARRDPMRAYFPAEMPHYPGAQMAPAGASLVSGSRSRLAYFFSADEPAKIADYFGSAWRKEGFWVRQSVTHLGGTVSAVDSKSGRVFQLLLSRQGDRTLAFPSVLEGLGGQQTSTAAPPVPAYPRSRQLLDTLSEAGPHRARVLVSVNGGTPAENWSHYRAALAGAGYRQEERKGGSARQAPSLAQTLRVYRHRNGSELTIVITPLDSEQTRVHLTVVEGR